MTFLSRGIASSDRRYPGSVDSLLEYHQNTGCRINGQECAQWRVGAPTSLDRLLRHFEPRLQVPWTRFRHDGRIEALAFEAIHRFRLQVIHEHQAVLSGGFDINIACRQPWAFGIKRRD